LAGIGAIQTFNKACCTDTSLTGQPTPSQFKSGEAVSQCRAISRAVCLLRAICLGSISRTIAQTDHFREFSSDMTAISPSRCAGTLHVLNLSIACAPADRPELGYHPRWAALAAGAARFGQKAGSRIAIIGGSGKRQQREETSFSIRRGTGYDSDAQ
jgi:hypothetical protein